MFCTSRSLFVDVYEKTSGFLVVMMYFAKQASPPNPSSWYLSITAGRFFGTSVEMGESRSP